jgi:Cdc6-like AAA superfamily ATPase
LLESKEFNYWLKGTTKKILWLQGKAGVGKSILCASVIDHLTSTFSSKGDVGIAYLYPDYATLDNSGPADLLAVLLKQLVQSLDMLPNSLQSLYEIHIQRNERPSFKEFLGVMKSVIQRYSRVFIVIDGLDEMAAPPQDREHILDAILQLQEDRKIHLFTTQNFTEKMLNRTGGIISMVAYADPKDLELYLTAQLPHLMESDIADSIGLSHLLKDIVKATDGM